MKMLHIALLVSLGMIPATAHAQEGMVTLIQERAAAHGVSGDLMVRIARCESRLNPQAVGDSGHSHGLFQIHDRGLFSLFRSWGYSDRMNAWESADFTARAIAAGLRSHWRC